MQWFRAQGGQSARHSLVCLLMLLFMACQAVAQGGPDPALQKGQQWLQAQTKPDGSLASESASPALPAQSRHETVAALKALNASVPATLIAGMDGFTAPATRYLAQRALTRQQAGADDASLLDALAALQNPNGSFGAAQGLPGNALDTAWALRALAASRASAQATLKALQWLASAQHADGSWPLAPDGDATITTALAAQALLAVLPGLDTAAAMQPALTALKQAQRPDGSWAGDPHLTALALRALRLAAQPATNPDLASVRGQVVDEAGQPLASATARLLQAGLQTAADAQGRFSFERLAAGAGQLEIQASGFRPLITPLQLQPGQQLDLGVIRMTASSSGNASAGVTLKGVAQQFNGTNYYTVSSAVIEAAGQKARTNYDGQYQLDNLPAGTLEITAAFPNFPAVTASLNAVVGQVIEFNPVFRKPELLVTVLDADSGQPLQDASVFFQWRTAYTSSNGQAAALMVDVAGDNRITITHANAYEQLMVPLEMPPKSMRTELTVSLRKAIAGKVVFKGVVTDAGTQQPLAGVSVRLERSTWQTQTNAQGEYEFASPAIAGNKTAVFEKAGYQTHSQEVQIQGGATVFNVALKPESASSGPARLEVSVQARGLGTPLAGAEIILTGANQRTAQTGADGRASVENLAPGSTQIQISAARHESAVASVHVEPGRRYELPVELLPQANPQHRLYGQVVDAVSQQPVAGAKVALTGAGAVTTAANGAYEFASVLPGDAQLEVTRDGYAAYRQTLRLTGTTEARIPLTPLSQPGAIRWDVSGAVVDADTLEPLAGAQLVLEEVSLGTAVLRRQTGATQADGRFAFNGLTQTNARVLVSLTGYDSALLPFAYQGVASQALDTIKLKRSYNAALPDLMVSRADRSALTMDDHTFRASGTLSATVTNNSNYDAGGFDVIAFIDANGNQAWDAGEDTLLGRERIAALAQQQSQSVTFRIRNEELPFRDAPIYVMADSGLEVIENIEGNNTLRVGVTCAGGGSVQDVGVCIDTSGSVSHLYNLEMEGVIKAVENPNIIPHDGSIRFMLGTDQEMYYGNGIPLHEAQIITPAVLPQLIKNLKDKRNYGGYSSGPTCVRRMSEYMKTLPQIASSRTVITVGDGYWEGIPKALSELSKTVANGVSRVDVIGIGSVNLPELEANAWPKPANSQHGGKVTVAYSAGEVAAAMAQALGTAAQTVDLTLGRLRLIDQGAGQPVRLAARVGNAGSPAQASAVRFYQGTRLLGEVALPALGTGEWLDVALPAAALQGNDPLIAVVDEARANAECNVANNRQQITPDAAANALAALHVSTDQPAYGPNAPVSLNAAATNQGSLPADFELQLSIEDSQGAEVARFTRQPLGTLAASAAKSATQPWNTGLTLTGNYTLRGQLFDAAGRLAAQDSAAFAIVAGGAARPTASLAVATDKAVYAPDDAVFIANVAASLAANAIIDDASVQLTVRGPQGSVVFTHSHALGQLAPRALRELQAAQKLRNAPEGIYTVQASLIGSGHNLKRQTARKTYDTGVTLATATAQYTVQKNTATPTPTPTPTPSPSGRIAAVPASSPAALALLAAAVALTARRRKNGAIRRAAHHTCHLDHATQETQP